MLAWTWGRRLSCTDASCTAIALLLCMRRAPPGGNASIKAASVSVTSSQYITPSAQAHTPSQHAILIRLCARGVSRCPCVRHPVVYQTTDGMGGALIYL